MPIITSVTNAIIAIQTIFLIKISIYTLETHLLCIRICVFYSLFVDHSCLNIHLCKHS
ncbi:hypothetical protein JHK82_019448 [Glycine max]|uniref:Uncharacterized protein n=1 Tax=Glycine max TaxID=3847 RepID=K7L338_SOYBN|nr:hypothetical protein JHK86_019463 [Glycine max]KAG5143753.1 hypothetical protein JHK82_019448 [Glycine max]KAH1087964.1 hypothetical protein GYH30_019168 [Glycine max]